MAISKYVDLAGKIAAAAQAGREAANNAPNDGGSANLDHVVLTDVKSVREDTLRRSGINGYKHRGAFHLDAPFPGQGLRRYEGVQAMQRSLQEAGAPCYVHYQID